MLNNVVLLDLEHHLPSASTLRGLLEHNEMMYVFHCQGLFHFALTDLTEFASWINSGQVVVLETPKAAHKEFEYAVVVGQLLALLDDDMDLELISAMPSSEMLLQLLIEAGFNCRLTTVAATTVETEAVPHTYPALQFMSHTLSAVLQTPLLQRVLPTVLQGLHGLQQQPIQPLRQWSNWALEQLNAHTQATSMPKFAADQSKTQTHFSDKDTDRDSDKDAVLDLKNDPAPSLNQSTVNAQQGLYRNFNRIDRLQIEVLRKLHLQSEMPKDIYQLRDLLEEIFPDADIALLLKELIEKGYIYWNGHEVIYSHEMYLN